MMGDYNSTMEIFRISQNESFFFVFCFCVCVCNKVLLKYKGDRENF